MDEVIPHPLFDSLNLFIRYERVPSLKALGYVCFWQGKFGGMLVLSQKAIRPQNVSRLSTSLLDRWGRRVGVEYFELPITGMSDKQYYIRIRYGFGDYSENDTYGCECIRPEALKPVACAFLSTRILFISEAHRLSRYQIDLLCSFCRARAPTSQSRLIPILIVRRCHLPKMVQRIKGDSNSKIRKMFLRSLSHADFTFADVDYW